MHRRLYFDQVTSNHEQAKYRLQEAERLYKEALDELKPGEVSPGVSEVMLRGSSRQKFRKALIQTPKLNAQAIFFTNGKSAYVEKIETNEDTLQPFIWITLESKKSLKIKAFKKRLKDAGL